MRSQFTWKWPPTLIEVVCFTYFAAGMRCNAPLYLAAHSPARLLAWLRNYLQISNEQNFRQAKIKSSGCMTGVRTKLKWLLRFLLIRASGESKLMGQPEPDSPDVQSPPHESDFIRCQRAFHLPLSHLSHNCVFLCHLWIMDGRRKQTYSADSSLL